MAFLFLITAIILVYMKYTNKLKWSWLTVGIVVVALLILPNLLKGGFGTLFSSLNSNTNDPLKTDACGCGPNQLVAVQRRNIWGKNKAAGVFPCGEAISRTSNRRYSIVGCVNG